LVHSFSKDRMTIVKPSWMRLHPTILLCMAQASSVTSAEYRFPYT
jgi:hypothetical protein